MNEKEESIVQIVYLNSIEVSPEESLQPSRMSRVSKVLVKILLEQNPLPKIPKLDKITIKKMKPAQMKEALKVGVSGVRGIVGKSFSPQVATEFAQAFGTSVGRGPVVVGRDTRTTGQMVENAVIAGLQSVGCQPVLAHRLSSVAPLGLAKRR